MYSQCRISGKFTTPIALLPHPGTYLGTELSTREYFFTQKGNKKLPINPVFTRVECLFFKDSQFIQPSSQRDKIFKKHFTFFSWSMNYRDPVFGRKKTAYRYNDQFSIEFRKSHQCFYFVLFFQFFCSFCSSGQTFVCLQNVNF